MKPPLWTGRISLAVPRHRPTKPCAIVVTRAFQSRSRKKGEHRFRVVVRGVQLKDWGSVSAAFRSLAC